MATWNDLFLNKEFVNITPQTEVYRLILNLQDMYNMKEIKIWDQCCGTGRHTILASKLGCKSYASDISANGVLYLNSWLKDEGLTAIVKEVDMITDPWSTEHFHGLFIGIRFIIIELKILSRRWI